MKLVKLSLVAAFAAGAFSAANAVSLEDAIKNVDLNGEFRYRYDTGRWGDGASAGGDISSKQEHKIRARLGLKADIADSFKVFGQVQYGEPETNEGGYGLPSENNKADTTIPIDLRQAYLEYNNADYATSILFGRQELGTIWTDDIVGFSGKLVNNYLEGTTLAAFWVDGIENGDGDEAFADSRGVAGGVYDKFWKQNIYGAAYVGGYDLGGSTLDAQVWLGYMTKRATLYAVDATYALPIDQDLTWSLGVSYLGNSLDSFTKEWFGAANGNLFNVKGVLEGYGFDGTLGWLMYGKKGETTISVLEDQGNFTGTGVGHEIIYSNGSRLTGATGKNNFVYANVGYTLPSDFRAGVQFVYGSTEQGSANSVDTLGEATGGGDKMEVAVDLSYAYSKNLEFLAYYSYFSYDPKVTGWDSNDKNTFRIEATYKF